MCKEPRLVAEVSAGVTRYRAYKTGDDEYTVFTYRGEELIAEEFNLNSGDVMSDFGINLEVLA